MREVLASLDNDQHDRCVDLLRLDGGFGFAEFRRDVEDAGRWTPVADHGAARFGTAAEALAAARAAIGWFANRATPLGGSSGSAGDPPAEPGEAATE